MQQFLQTLKQSLDDGTFIALTFSKPTGSNADDAARRITVHPVEIRGRQLWQWTRQMQRQQSHENLDAPQTLATAASLFGSTFRHAHLFTTHADVAARIDKSGRCRLTTGPPTKKPSESTNHDRQKQYLIPEGRPCPFLHELGIMTAEGRVHRARQDKFRQINRFLEFVEDIVPHLPAQGPLDVVDFGCGLSYLTFALHHLLAVIRHREVRIVGIDQNPQVISRCTDTCRALELRGLEFITQPITTITSDRKVHLAVALHACDTATDDALAQAVRWQADVILAAPCCQHELAPQLTGDALTLITRHGILRERFAAMATDALRAALLEQAGYRTQIIEFIDTEHTPKNLLLRAVRRDVPQAGSRPDPQLSRRIDELKTLLGINHLSLTDRLREPNQSPER